METGHGKNIAKFSTLISHIQAHGPNYAPALTALTPTELIKLLNQAQTLAAKLADAEAAYTNAVNERQIAYAPLSKLVVRIINAFQAFGGTPQAVADLRILTNKVTGSNVSRRTRPATRATSSATSSTSPTPPPTASNSPATPSTNTSVSRQSFDVRLENLGRIISFLQSHPFYAPNEPELTPASLQTYHAQLTLTNQNVAKAHAALNNLRNERDVLLYTPAEGLVARASAVKKYVKARFGARSAQYLDIASLKFISAPRH